MNYLLVILLLLLHLPCQSSASSFDPHLSDIVGELLDVEKVPRYWPKANDADWFAVELDAPTWHQVQGIAHKAGFDVEGRLQSFKNVYIASRKGRRKRSTGAIIEELISLKEVQWAEQLTPLYREKKSLVFSDPMYEQQMQSWSAPPEMHIAEAWAEGHEDLRDAFKAEISHSFVRMDTAPKKEERTHGTRCAGIIAMAANNSKCGVGVAYRSTLGGLTVFAENQFLNDAIEGDALAFKADEIDIFSVSWGPKDDGRSAERPGSLAQKALEFGALHGRKGLGSLYVWASGNGGLEDDDCSMDGYASNMHTMTFGVATSSGIPPWYAEGCSAVIASVTTDVGGECTTFAGSSAAAPLAAGILALALEANPALSQRDIQHLVVHTSNSDHLQSSSPAYWLTNRAGLHFSRQFGFGVLDAQKLVRFAKTWKSVGPLASCSRQLTVTNGTFGAESPVQVDLPFEGCAHTSGEVNWMERLRLEVTIEHPRRGLISLFLTSPAGTTIQLLHPRKNDDSADGLSRWPFVSVAQWGENPRGIWRIEVHSMAHKDVNAVGVLKSAVLTVQGTRDDPMKENGFLRPR
ncbi:unnamed protein product [Nippostrongylus brasiliensis]|uniref:Neuroendocrine convertase 1 (inferred by orthology to a human protein) n=1 Tax=Nippostrongylus brasiliensis TaxID=27835 RepID=A0A0N4YHK3_NIPBR|nr:unnamed protein product [Nippostrongylus brasiliensis]